MNPPKKTFVIIAIMLAAGSGLADGTNGPAVSATATIELHDQYDAPQELSFPTTNLTVLTIADKKGSEQVDGWIAALKPRYARRIEIRGLADVGGVPWFLRARIRQRFQETRTYPVMMDWSGKVCAQLGYEPGLANILILGRDGSVIGRLTGAAAEPTLGNAFKTIDTALAGKNSPPASGAPTMNNSAKQ